MTNNRSLVFWTVGLAIAVLAVIGETQAARIEITAENIFANSQCGDSEVCELHYSEESDCRLVDVVDRATRKMVGRYRCVCDPNNGYYKENDVCIHHSQAGEACVEGASRCTDPRTECGSDEVCTCTAKFVLRTRTSGIQVCKCPKRFTEVTQDSGQIVCQ